MPDSGLLDSRLQTPRPPVASDIFYGINSAFDRYGLKPKYGCRSGVCGICACKLLRGKISYLQAPTASTPKGTVLLCSAQPESDVIFLSSKNHARANQKDP